MAANPRRRRRRRASSYRPATRSRKRTTTRRRRRNVQINPLILSNPPRRRRRRNPRMKLDLKTIINKSLTYGGGGLLAYAANQFGARNIQNDWLRRGVQVAGAIAGAMMLKGELGASFAGGMMYPFIGDMALTLGVVTASDYELAELAADLDTALSDGGYYQPELAADLSGVTTEELFIDGLPSLF